MGKPRRDDATWWFEVCKALKTWRVALEQRLYAAVVPVAEAETLLWAAIAESRKPGAPAALGPFLLKKVELGCARHAAAAGRPFNTVLAVLEQRWDWLQGELASTGLTRPEQGGLLTGVLHGGPLWAGEKIWGAWFEVALRESCERARSAGQEEAHGGDGRDPGRPTDHA